VHRLRDLNPGPGLHALQGIGREVSQLCVNVCALRRRWLILLRLPDHRHHLDVYRRDARNRIRMSRDLGSHCSCPQTVFPR